MKIESGVLTSKCIYSMSALVHFWQITSRGKENVATNEPKQADLHITWITLFNQKKNNE